MAFGLDKSLAARQAPGDEIDETANARAGGEDKKTLHQMRQENREALRYCIGKRADYSGSCLLNASAVRV